MIWTAVRWVPSARGDLHFISTLLKVIFQHVMYQKTTMCKDLKSTREWPFVGICRVPCLQYLQSPLTGPPETLTWISLLRNIDRLRIYTNAFPSNIRSTTLQPVVLDTWRSRPKACCSLTSKPKDTTRCVKVYTGESEISEKGLTVCDQIFSNWESTSKARAGWQNHV